MRSRQVVIVKGVYFLMKKNKVEEVDAGMSTSSILD